MPQNDFEEAPWRQVCLNMGDVPAPLVRSRYPAMEIATHRSDELDTPLLSALRATSFNPVVGGLGHRGGARCASSTWSSHRRSGGPCRCMRRSRSLVYGTGSAYPRWEAYLVEALEEMGLSRARSSPCRFLPCATGEVRCVVQGGRLRVRGLGATARVGVRGEMGRMERRVSGRGGGGSSGASPRISAKSASSTELCVGRGTAWCTEWTRSMQRSSGRASAVPAGRDRSEGAGRTPKSRGKALSLLRTSLCCSGRARRVRFA